MIFFVSKRLYISVSYPKFMTSKERLSKTSFSSFSFTQYNAEEENKILRDTISQLKNEVDRFRSPALMVADVVDVLKDNAVIKVPNGNKFYVNISSNLKSLKAGDTVLVEQKNLTIVDKIRGQRKFNVQQFVIFDKPSIVWEDIGGLDAQKNEIVEVVELPLKRPELFLEVGITPPKGILLYGPPGTGKTLLAKAVAQSTNSYFIQVVASELVQKFIGEGAKLVKEIFDMARKNAPSIIFIDEVDALAARRVEIGTSGEREVQRTFMQLLSEIDGFKALEGVKIIGCTNRLDILDPAILRPGRLDRLIHVPLPDKSGAEQILKIHTKRMNLDADINMKTVLNSMVDFTGADINAMCTESGYFAIRESRTNITEKDLLEAAKKIRQGDDFGYEHLEMFG